MLPEFGAVGRDPVLGGVVPAAIERPMVWPEAAADNAGSEVAMSAAQRDVGLTLAEVAKVLAIIEFDHDLRMALMQFAQHRREQHHEDFLGGNSNGAAGVALLRSRSFDERRRGAIHLPRALDQPFARRSEGVTGLALFKDREAERVLEGRDTARDGGLADPELSSGRKRAA